MSRKRKQEKFVTFKEQQHKDFLKEVFNTLLIAGIFMFAAIPVFGVYPNALVTPDSEWKSCLRIIIDFLYAGVGIYVPFLIYNVIKYKSSGRYFTNKGSAAKPTHYVLGILAGLGISVSFNLSRETAFLHKPFLLPRQRLFRRFSTKYLFAESLSETYANKAMLLRSCFRGCSTVFVSNLFSRYRTSSFSDFCSAGSISKPIQ